MSGPLVDIIGGPLDGRQRHRQLSTGGSEEIIADAGNGLVHVWHAVHPPDAPFMYRGTRRASRYDGANCISWGVTPLLRAIRSAARQRRWRLAAGLLRYVPDAVAWSVKHGGLYATWHRPDYMIPSWRVNTPTRDEGAA